MSKEIANVIYKNLTTTRVKALIIGGKPAVENYLRDNKRQLEKWGASGLDSAIAGDVYEALKEFDIDIF